MTRSMMAGVAAGLWLVSQVAVAQTPAKPAAKPAAAKAAPAKGAKASPAAKGPMLAAATDEQKAAAQRVYVGDMPCDFGVKVRVQPDPANAGYFNVSAPKFAMKAPAVVTSTGVVRIEDAKQGIWLQAGNKSMLINTKMGQRVADGCANDVQKQVAADMANKPAGEGLLGK
jgi:hypothetical protein